MPELWVILLVIVPIVVGLVWMIYRRERKDVGMFPKVIMTGIRACLLLLIIALLLGPVIIVTTIKHRKSFLIVMVDNSRSMQKKDPPLDPKDKLTLARVTNGAEEHDDATAQIPAEVDVGGHRAREVGLDPSVRHDRRDHGLTEPDDRIFGRLVLG